MVVHLGDLRAVVLEEGLPQVDQAAAFINKVLMDNYIIVNLFNKAVVQEVVKVMEQEVLAVVPAVAEEAVVEALPVAEQE